MSDYNAPILQYQELADPLLDPDPPSQQTWHAIYPSVIRYIDVMVADGFKPDITVQ